MFRNRELRRFAALFVGIAAVATAVGFALHPAAGRRKEPEGQRVGTCIAQSAQEPCGGQPVA